MEPKTPLQMPPQPAPHKEEEVSGRFRSSAESHKSDRDRVIKHASRISVIVVAVCIIVILSYSLVVAKKKRDLKASTDAAIIESCSPAQATASGYQFGAEGIPVSDPILLDQAKSKALNDFQVWRDQRQATQDDFISGMENIITALAVSSSTSQVTIDGESYSIPSLARGVLFSYPKFMMADGGCAGDPDNDDVWQQPTCPVLADAMPMLISRAPYVPGNWSPSSGYFGLDIPLGDSDTNTVTDGYNIQRADTQLAINRSLIGNTLHQFLAARLAFEQSKPIVTVTVTERKGGDASNG